MVGRALPIILAFPGGRCQPYQLHVLALPGIPADQFRLDVRSDSRLVQAPAGPHKILGGASPQSRSTTQSGESDSKKSAA